MAEIQKAADEHDSQKISKNAHPLKSSSGMMGLRKVSAISENIEATSNEGISDFSNGSEIHKLISNLEDTLSIGIDRLEKEIKTV